MKYDLEQFKNDFPGGSRRYMIDYIVKHKKVGLESLVDKVMEERSKDGRKHKSRSHTRYKTKQLCKYIKGFAYIKNNTIYYNEDFIPLSQK